jgi:PAS domain S-box-containing protein
VKGDDQDENVRSAMNRFQNLSEKTPRSTKSLRKYVQTICSLDRVPNYVESPNYVIWRAQERAAVFEMMVTPFSSKNNKVHPSPHSRKNSTEKSFYSLLEADYEKVMISSSWIPSLIASSEHLPLSICLLHDTDKSFIYINRLFEKLTGYSQEDMRGSSLRILRNVEGEDKVMNEIELNFESRKWFGATLKVFCKNETEIVLEFYFKPIFDQYMDCQYWIGLVQDLSDRKSKKISLCDLITLLPSRVVI